MADLPPRAGGVSSGDDVVIMCGPQGTAGARADRGKRKPEDGSNFEAVTPKKAATTTSRCVDLRGLFIAGRKVGGRGV